MELLRMLPVSAPRDSAIVLLLDDADPGVARAAAERLVGEPPTRSLLLERLGGGTPRERLMVVEIFARTQYLNEFRPAFTRHLKDDDRAVRIAVAHALFDHKPAESILPPDVEDLLPVLLEALEDPQSGTRAWAAVELGGFGRRAAAALPTLHRMLRDDVENWDSIVSGIDRIDHQAWGPSMPLLEEGLASEYAKVRARSVCAYGIAGGDPARVVATAGPLLEHNDAQIRLYALSGLWRAGSGAGPLVKPVAALLGNHATGEGMVAGQVLATLAPDSDEALAALVAVLLDRKRTDRVAVLWPLRAFKKKSIPALVEAMADPAIRVHTILSIEEMGEDAAAAIPALEAAALDTDLATSLAARRALVRVKGGAK